jgi:hypothetical protein
MACSMGDQVDMLFERQDEQQQLVCLFVGHLERYSAQGGALSLALEMRPQRCATHINQRVKLVFGRGREEQTRMGKGTETSINVPPITVQFT